MHFLSQDEQKRKNMPPGGGRKKISLEAVLKTTCSKCGITGHLAKDCFQVSFRSTCYSFFYVILYHAEDS